MPQIDAIQLRRGTAAAWTSANPVLMAGEPGIETDTNKWKVGDGTSTWTALSYQNIPASDAAQNISSLRAIFTGTPSPLGTAAAGNSVQAAAGNHVHARPTNIVNSEISATAAIAESKLSLASDAAAGTASRRTLGTGALQAAAGNDPRLSDTRTPTDGSVTDAKVAAGAAIAESKLALASDAAAGTASRRTLGTGATQAAAGNDPRLSDARTPTAHAATHATNGSDPLAPAAIGAVSKAGGDTIEVVSAATTPLTLKAAAAQTANIQEWQDSTGAVLNRITSGGVIADAAASSFLLHPTNTTQNLMTAKAVGNLPLAIKGLSGQTQDLQQWITNEVVVGAVKPDGSTTLKKTVVIPHTWHVPGEVKVANAATDYIIPFYIPVPTGQSVTFLGGRHWLQQGTSVGFDVRRNSANISAGHVATGAGTTFANNVALANNDDLAIVVTSVSGTPKNFLVTIFLQYTF